MKQEIHLSDSEVTVYQRPLGGASRPKSQSTLGNVSVCLEVPLVGVYCGDWQILSLVFSITEHVFDITNVTHIVMTKLQN